MMFITIFLRTEELMENIIKKRSGEAIKMTVISKKFLQKLTIEEEQNLVLRKKITRCINTGPFWKYIL